MTEVRTMADPNFLTGSNGLIAIDKLGNQVCSLTRTATRPCSRLMDSPRASTSC